MEPVAVELDFSQLTEDPDVPVTDESDSAYNDYVENNAWNKVIEIAFNGEQATVTGSVPGPGAASVSCAPRASGPSAASSSSCGSPDEKYRSAHPLRIRARTNTADKALSIIFKIVPPKQVRF